jgi:hypothetical protein
MLHFLGRLPAIFRRPLSIQWLLEAIEHISAHFQSRKTHQIEHSSPGFLQGGIMAFVHASASPVS